MIEIENKLYIRPEKNGITVYEKDTNLYKFYENLEIKKIEKLNTLKEIQEYLDTKSNLVSTNIDYSKPFRINWLIEERCNLDCIYCFADDKMENNETRENILETANHILDLGVMNVGLSGGEPTISPYLKDVIETFKGKCSINIDTNGTINQLGDMAKLLKEANVLVRITIDSVNPKILSKVRPCKNKNLKQLEIIKDNIKKLQKENVPVMIHTVVTQINKDYLFDIAKELVDLGVKRWHMYGVNYAEKCKDFYEDIKLTNSELNEVYLAVKKEFGDKINMSVYFDEGNYSANSVLLVNSEGKFYLDSIKNGIHYIGENPKLPTLEEINNDLDTKLHCKGYLWTPNLL